MPYGLEMTLTCTENVLPRRRAHSAQYAETGEYEIIWAHSAYWEAVEALRSEFPDLTWMYTGSGNEAIGGNAYWGDVFIHEPAYLAGIIAGSMTETNKLGAVAAFTFPNVNGPVNAFYDGARSVNPDIEMTVTYIESWFDPVKGKEAATAMIATGVDVIYAERFGPFEAAQEGGILAFGHFLDQHSLAPDVVVASPMALWDPNIRNIIEKWYDYTVNGVEHDARWTASSSASSTAAPSFHLSMLLRMSFLRMSRIWLLKQMTQSWQVRSLSPCEPKLSKKSPTDRIPRSTSFSA